MLQGQAALERKGVPPNEQICLCDPPAADPNVTDARVGSLSRFSPGTGTSTRTVRPRVADLAVAGKKMLTFEMNASQAVPTSGTENNWFNYTLHTATDTFSIELELAALLKAGETDERLDVFKLRTSHGEVSLRYAPGAGGWSIRHRTSLTNETSDDLSTQLAIDGSEHTIRIVYTASSDPAAGARDGTIEVWITPAGESVMDWDVLGGGIVPLTRVVNATHANGAVEDIRIGWVAATNYDLADVEGDGMVNGYVAARYMALFMDQPTPGAAGIGGTPWVTDHYALIEKADGYWSGGLFNLRVACVWPEHYFPGTVTRNMRLRAYTDHSLIGGNTGATISDGNWSAVSLDPVGYARRTFQITGLPADTPVWVEVQMQGDGFFHKSSDAPVPMHACYRTPQTRGVNSTAAPDIRVSSCINTSNWGPHEMWWDWLNIGVGESDGVRTHLRSFQGDYAYQDERLYNKGGFERTGAETEAQIKDCVFSFMHSYSAKMASARFLMRCTGDDHCRTVNDAVMADLLREDGTGPDWPFPNRWSKRGVAVNNPRVGYPNAVEPATVADEYEYGIPPDDYAQLMLAMGQDIFSGTLPPTSSDQRMSAAGIAHYAGSPSTFSDGDAQYSFLDIGNVRHVFLDTRIFADRSDVNEGTWLGAAKSWVLNVIATCDLPGIVFHLPGYMQGVGGDGQGFSLKQNDNYASSVPGSSDFTAELNEVFKVAIDENGDIVWAGIICGDHHFLSIDQTISGFLSSKFIWQLASGGTMSAPQAPENIGDTGYLLLTDGSDNRTDLDAAAGHTVRTMLVARITNEETGATTASAYRITGDGRDELGVFNLIASTPATAGTASFGPAPIVQAVYAGP